jgi:hypothetical protein
MIADDRGDRLDNLERHGNRNVGRAVLPAVARPEVLPPRAATINGGLET